MSIIVFVLQIYYTNTSTEINEQSFIEKLLGFIFGKIELVLEDVDKTSGTFYKVIKENVYFLTYRIK